MTDKRERIITDPGLGPTDPHRPSVLRSVEATPVAELNPNAPVYYEPSPLVAISNHRTLELETVKLSDDIDPRKLQTELRMDRVPSYAPPYAPPSDSFWPPETALATSQPPPSPGRRWRAPVVLVSVLCALLLLVVGRAVARHSAALAARQSGIAQTVSGAGLAPLGATLSTASTTSVPRSSRVASPTLIQNAAAPVAVSAPIGSTTTASVATPTPAVDNAAPTQASAPAPTALNAVSGSAPAGSASAQSAASGSAAPARSAASGSAASAQSAASGSAASAEPDGASVSSATARVHGTPVPPHGARLTPPLGAPLAEPSASKPKRAIY